MAVIPVILCGGSGTRLWPLSRSMFPKQFLDLTGSGSLLEATLKRLPEESGFTAPIIICNNDHRFLVADITKNSGNGDARIVLEPAARNTAPAIAVAAVAALEKDPDAILAVMPSDHMIGDVEGFRKGVEQASRIAKNSKLVLFGIKPDHAHTGYGYIKRGDSLDPNEDAAFHVAKFTEKPDAETAEGYLSDGGYDWNSGIFVLNAGYYMRELERLHPQIATAARAAWKASTIDLDFIRLDTNAFTQSPSLSIDYAVMEHTPNAVVIPLDIGWNDIGSWASLADISPADDDGNSRGGYARDDSQAMFTDTQNTFVYSTRSLVSTLGVKDLVIVETPDALLVADRNRTQDVGKIVEQIKTSGGRLHEQHLRSYRPWGFFEQLCVAERFQVKLLHVNPGGQLSMQMHFHRSEHWVVVKGTAKVTIADKEQLVSENSGVYISATEWHRLENPGKVPLELIEVQLGAYLGEDDIIRSDDIYKRAASETA